MLGRSGVSMRQMCAVFGMAMLLAQMACGAIVYSGLLGVEVSNSHSNVGLDIDGNTPDEFVFEYTSLAGEMELRIAGVANPGRFFACQQLGPIAGPPMRMDAGGTIGPELLWLSSKDDGLLAGFYDAWSSGRFLGEAGYIGIKFELIDGWHYGWIGFETQEDASSGLITGWAFEDIPDQPIEAGQVPEHNPVGVIESPNSRVFNTCAGYTIDFTMRATDQGGDLRLSEVYLDGSFQGHAAYDDGYDGTATWSHKFDTAGTYTVSFNTLDLAGNYGTGDQWTVEVDVYSDSTGTLEVTITPQEAVEAGARWKVVGYTEWLDSEQAAYDLPPGYLRVDFNGVEGWFEPETLWVRTIGHLPVSEIVEYKRVPGFQLGQIPPGSAPHGMTLEFYVEADWLQDPLFTMAIDDEPVGAISLDTSSGLFLYEPNEAYDRVPFNVTFAASSGADANEQTVTISPNAKLPAEYAIVSRPTQDYPDPCDRDYVVVNEIELQEPSSPSTYVLFNCEMRATRSVTIAGKTVVFEQGNYWYDQYNYDPSGGTPVADIKDLTIYAETVVIRDPLHLPQTDVTIYARDLIFEDYGDVNTTPLGDWASLAPINTNDGPIDGNDGHPAGDIRLYIETFDANPHGQTRFIMKGGIGQVPEPGSDGADGNDLCTYPINWVGTFPPAPADWATTVVLARYWLKVGSPGRMEPGTLPSGCTPLLQSCSGTVGEWDCDMKWWTNWRPIIAGIVNGKDAVEAGTPGTGGGGGDLSCTLNVFVDSVVDNGGGQSGAPADTNGLGYYKAGQHGEPSIAYKVMYQRYYDWTAVEEIYTRPDPAKDANAPLPETPYGADGSNTLSPRAIGWLTPYALKMVIAHASDAYLYGYGGEAAEILQEYYDLLNSYMVLGEWNELPETWQFEFEQMHHEIGTLLHRLQNGMDYFGNPPNYVPMLSLEITSAFYQQEIDRAIRVLYLSYWVQHAKEKYDQKAEALTEARQILWQDTEQFRSDYETVADFLVPLKKQASQIAARLGDESSGLVWQLKRKESELLYRADQNVQERHKVPWWKKVLGVLGGIAGSTIEGGARKGTAGAIGGFLSGTLGALTSELSQHEDPWPAIVNRTDVVKQFNSIDFDEAAGQSLGVFNNITDLQAIEADAETYLNSLRASGADMADGMHDIKEALKATSLSNEEVEIELMKIKAADPEFNKYVDEVTELMAQKEIFNLQVAACMQKVSTLANGITNNLLAIDSLNRQASNVVIDPRAAMYVKDMERRALERLRKYHYYVAKAYEYRLLKPYGGDLNIQSMFDKLLSIVDTPFDPGYLNSDSFQNLKAAYEEQLWTLTDEIYTDYQNNPSEEYTSALRISLTAEELADLNTIIDPDSMLSRPVSIDLKDRLSFMPEHENIRILDVAVEVIDVNLVYNGDYDPSDYFLLHIDHSGVSNLQKDGQIYRFVHHKDITAQRSPFAWDQQYDVHPTSPDEAGTLTAVERSDKSAQLLWSLLENCQSAGVDDFSLYVRPAAWADIVIQKQPHPANNADMVIDDLMLRVRFDRIERQKNKTMHIATGPDRPAGLPEDDLLPYYLVYPQDSWGRQDGIGDFYRTYSVGETVTIEAPATYGNYDFVAWTRLNGDPVDFGTVLEEDLDVDKVRIARYQYIGPLPGPTDFNKDFYVDWMDYSALSSAWHTGPGDAKWDAMYDVSKPADGVIDMLDIVEFAEDWMMRPY